MRQHGGILAVLAVVILTASLAGMPASAQDRSEPGCVNCDPEPPTPRYVPGQVLVRFWPVVPKARGAQVVAAEGAVRVREIDGLEVQVLKLPPGESVEEAVEQFNKRPEVKYAQPNYIRRITVVDDPGLDNQWGPQRIEAPAAWEVTGGDPSVVIAILDTGVDYRHSELAPNMWQNPGETDGNGEDDDDNGFADDLLGWDFANNDNDPLDDHWHGTHVAGIAAADDNANPDGLVGICPDCRLMAVKVLDAGGSAPDTRVVDGMQYAVAQGAQVINISAGGLDESPVLEDAVNDAWAAGTLVVAGAGNNGLDTPFYPAAYANAIAVGSSGPDDLRSYFSNYDTANPFVDVVAPGEAIFSTLSLTGGADNYGPVTGTSMSTPHVSGLVGLVISHFTDKGHAWVRARVEGTSDDVSPAGYDAYYGWGRVNANRALRDPDPPTQPPPPPVNLLPATSQTASAYAHARKLARDPAGTLHLTWHAQQGTDYQVLYASSTDSGVSWSEPQVVFSDPAETYHPALALDADYVYIVFPSMYGSTKYRTFFQRKPLVGGSWFADPVALTGEAYHAVRPDLYLDPSNGRLHMLASSHEEVPYLFYRASGDQGATWEPDPAQMIDPNDPDEPDCTGIPRYGSVHAHGDNIYIVGRTHGEVEYCIIPGFCFPAPIYCTQMVRSTDGGLTWPDAVDGQDYKEKLASWIAINTAEYGLSLAGDGDRLYLGYEVGSGGSADGGLFFRRWDAGTGWSTYEQVASAGRWPTISQASDGQAWMMWEDAGSIKMRHHTGSIWESTETLTDPALGHAGYYPNLEPGVDSGQLAWVYTTSHTPYGIYADSRSLTPTAADLVTFGVTPAAGGLLLAWETAQETTTLGFNLYRAGSGLGQESGRTPGRLNERLIPARSPGSPAGASYAFLDRSADQGEAYLYWLETVDVYGQGTRHDPVAGRLLGSSGSVYLPLVLK